MRTRGFTLIELMISMALFGLIAAGAMSLVVSGARAQSHAARVDVAQSSLRAAVDFITRDVLMASAGAVAGNITRPNGTVVPAIDFTAVITAHNNLGVAPYATGTDVLELYNVDGTTAAQINTAAAGSATSLPITYEQATTGATGVFNNAVAPFNTFVQVFDVNATTAAVVPLTGASATTLTVGALPIGFAVNSYVMPSRHVIYSVESNYFASSNVALQNTSMLMMSINGSAAQPLAEGVEDLQIAYGFDTDNDKVVTETGLAADDDEWLYNVPNDTIKATMLIANLRTIRVTLVVKSTSVDTGQQNLPARPAAEDHAVGSQDGFVRRVLRTEIAVRNFN